MFKKISFLSLLAMIAAMLIFMPQATLANCEPDKQCRPQPTSTPKPVSTIEVDIVEIKVNIADADNDLPRNDRPDNPRRTFVEVAKGLISIQAKPGFTLTQPQLVNNTFTLTPLVNETFRLGSSGTDMHLYQIEPAPDPDQYQSLVYEISNNYDVECASYSYASGSPNTGIGAPSSPPTPAPADIDETDFDEQWAFSLANGINKGDLLDSQQGQNVQIAIIDQFETNSDQASWTTVFLAPDPDILMEKHGELVTSLVQAVSPQSSQIAVPVLNLSGRTHSHALLKSINQLIKGKQDGLWPDLRVVNMSLGFEDIDDCTKGVLDHLLAQGEGQGIVFVGAAGNDSSPENLLASNYPANSDMVIGVGATNNQNQIASYSNEGEIYAPGGDCDCENPPDCTDSAIIGWTPPHYPDTRDYWLMTGTSFATPLVSALAADILSCNNSLTPEEVRAAIEDHANHANSHNIIDMQATLANACE